MTARGESGKNDGGEAVLAAILSAAMTARMTRLRWFYFVLTGDGCWFSICVIKLGIPGS